MKNTIYVIESKDPETGEWAPHDCPFKKMDDRGEFFTLKGEAEIYLDGIRATFIQNREKRVSRYVREDGAMGGE